jgi:predicted ArsR family transcriptional regulator
LIELLRTDEGLGIGELSKRLGVTATAVRQRLDRLMRAGLVGRTTVSGGHSDGGRRAVGRLRGRPSHVYNLTEKGRRTGGDNFRDLAMVLWREIRGVREPAVRQGLLARIGSAMADMYRPQIRGETVADRLESVAGLMRSRSIACGVEPAASGAQNLPVLASYACPYPELAEEDRTICAAERLMIQELAGAPVALSECRLDGAGCCRFTADASRSGEAAGLETAPGLENEPVAASNAERFHPLHSPARASERVV